MALQQRNPLRSRGDDLAVALGLVLAAVVAVRLVPMLRERRKALYGSPSPASNASVADDGGTEPVTGDQVASSSLG